MSNDSRQPPRIPSVPGVKRRTEPQAHPIPLVVRAQTAAPIVEADDEITGNHAGDELATLRSHRPTNERIGRLEGKHDKLDDIVRGIDRRLSTQDGQLDQLVKIGVRAEERDITKARLDRPVKIITAVFVGIASVIVALKELL